MKVKVGCDILQINKFQHAFKKHPVKFKRDIFHSAELKDSRIEHLAGVFAAKEAVMKALGIKPGLWKLIEIKNASSGKPYVKLSPKISKDIISSDISISHHGEYAVAVAVFLAET